MSSRYLGGLFVLSLAFVCCPLLPAAAPVGEIVKVPLSIDSGVPLRLYLTKRLPKHIGEPVHAKVLEPVFAFDRQIIPAGAEVLGLVTALRPVDKHVRAAAMLAGDFTPLHRAEVQFTTLRFPDGHEVALDTVATSGLNTIVSFRKAKKAKKPNAGHAAHNGGLVATAKHQAKDQIKSQINARLNARTHGIADLVRGPDKKERLEEFLVAKLPYHPQWVRKGTRFDAELRDPLRLGDAEVKRSSLALLGTQPPPDSIAHARLLTPLNSAVNGAGENVDAVLSQPLFGTGGALVLPAGTHITGHVTLARPARWFHRGGKLRFTFQSVELPDGTPAFAARTAAPAPAGNTIATLQNAEASGKTPVKVDDEGEVRTAESKTRFVAPAIAGLIAMKSLDNDEGRASADGNPMGRSLGGGSGFGLLGLLAAQSSPLVGSALGIYGMGWSVFNNIVARGSEVEFSRNAALDIRFGAPHHVAAAAHRNL